MTASFRNEVCNQNKKKIVVGAHYNNITEAVYDCKKYIVNKSHGDSTNTSALTRSIESDLGNDQIDNKLLISKINNTMIRMYKSIL